MDKIGAFTATADENGEFTAGNPAQSKPATTVKFDYMNMLQREVLTPVEYYGLVPDKNDGTQLLQAIQEAIDFDCLVHLGNAATVAQTPAVDTWTAVLFDQVARDRLNAVSGHQIVIPEGVSRVRFCSSLRVRPTVSAGFYRTSVAITAGVDPGVGQAIAEGYGDQNTHCAVQNHAAVYDVTPGQAFALWVKGSAAYQLERYLGSWFAMQVVK